MKNLSYIYAPKIDIQIEVVRALYQHGLRLPSWGNIEHLCKAMRESYKHMEEQPYIAIYKDTFEFWTTEQMLEIVKDKIGRRANSINHLISYLKK